MKIIESRFHHARYWLLGLLLLAAAGTVRSEARFVQYELVIDMVEGHEIDLVNTQFGTTVAQHLPQLDIYLVNTSVSSNLDSLAELIESLPDVDRCHPNYLIDPLQPVQGSLPISDEQHYGTFWEQEAAQTLNLNAVHQLSTGAGIIVGVLDGGTNYDHPVLAGAVVSGYDYVDDDSDAYDELGGANSGHGTFVSGVIRLMAPDAEIRTYRVSDTTGEGDGYMVAEAMLQAIEDGCSVLNLSLVTVAEHVAIVEAAAFARENNVVVVVAAGNGFTDDSHFPASDINTIAVAAVDTSNILADFSSYGEHIDICAPGTAIYGPYQDTGYAWWGGTSFAAPFVAAQVALIQSLLPGIPWDNVYELITTTAENIDDVNAGYTGLIGAGLIDPDSTMALLNADRECGDLRGGGSIAIDDMIALVDYLYGSNPWLMHLDKADVDQWEGVNANDLQQLFGYVFKEGPPPDCTPVYQGPFPMSEDSIEIRNLRLPAHQTSWTSEVWLKTTAEFEAIAVPLQLSVLQPDITLDSIEADPGIASDFHFEDVSADGRSGVLALHYAMTPSPTEATVMRLATLHFSGCHAEYARVILLNAEMTPPSNVLSLSRDTTVDPYRPVVIGTAANPIADDYCGDVDGNLSSGGAVDMSDILYLKNYLYHQGPPPPDESAADVDGVPGVSNNDLSALHEQVLNSGTELFCCGEQEPGYALSDDTLKFIGVSVTPGSTTWAVDMWSCTESAYYSLCASISYACGSSTLVLDSIQWHAQGSMPNEQLIDNQSQHLLTAVNGVSGPAGYMRLATLHFSMAPLSEEADIVINLATFPGTELTTLYSRPSAGSMTGSVPVLHVVDEGPAVDAYGHRCYGDMRGNIDCGLDEEINIQDLTLLVQYMFQNGAPLECVGEADVAPIDGPDGEIQIDDLIGLVQYMFGGGQLLPVCIDAAPAP